MGNGFIWTDEELAESFPAIAQMPLGSANDFGNILGWGQPAPERRDGLETPCFPLFSHEFHRFRRLFSGLWCSAELSCAELGNTRVTWPAARDPVVGGRRP